MTSKNSFTKQELAYYKIINDYFNKCTKDDITKIINIIEGNTSYDNNLYTLNTDKCIISLRIIDWFVTNYSKYRSLIKLPFDLRIKYKAQLKSFNKKYFDPFKRTQTAYDKFEYKFNVTGVSIKTTIGQLNFFKWALENGIIGYIEEHYMELKKEMKEYKQKELEKKSQSKTTSLSETQSTSISLEQLSHIEDKDGKFYLHL